MFNRIYKYFVICQHITYVYLVVIIFLHNTLNDMINVGKIAIT